MQTQEDLASAELSKAREAHIGETRKEKVKVKQKVKQWSSGSWRGRQTVRQSSAVR